MPEVDIDAILRAGEKLADETEVLVLTFEDLSLEQREMAVAAVSEHAGTSIYIRAVTGGRIGVSATSDPTRWKDCLTAAVSSAKLAEPVEGWKGLPGPAALPAGDDPFDPHLSIDPDTASALLARMNEGATAHPDARVVTAGVSLSKGSSVLANSHGVRYERQMTGISLGLDAIADGSTGYEYDASPFLSRIDPEKMGEQTAFWATASRNGVAVPTGRRDVVLSEHVVDSLILELFTEAVNGRNVLTGKSVFAGKLGENVADSSISIADVPMDPRGNSMRRFDTEGTPASRCGILEDGVLSSFLYDCKTAAQAGTASTGHALRGGNGATYISPHCLRVSGDVCDVTREPCLFVREVIGAHTANPLTGEFSVEVANAFLMENGEFVQPVKKAMIAGNVFEMLRQIDGISAETRVFDGAVVPRMRISSMQVIG
ncbi:MAG TPA: metallopeptidase TldD-related protein [Methanocorpusculum sp.]|nr:metallopeptidase TldD-related protein [Methanocorpusculum sp.]HJK79387.1 metallopeptidase TldD-related protein [Methanocorpusculum sp.]